MKVLAKKTLRVLVNMLAVFALGASAFATAQDYPSKAIRLIVPQPPGGPTDTVGRMVAEQLSKKLNQPVVVENRPGAGSIIGSDAVAKAPPDGYTLGLATLQHIVNPFLYASLPFDTMKDFVPVTLISKADIVLVTNAAVPATNLKELVALAKKEPGKLAWAFAGNGGTGHLALEMFSRAADIDVLKVPYKGTQPALTDLLGGRVSAMFDGVVTSLPHIKAGKLRAIAVASSTRSKLLPDVPTIAESGYPGFEAAGLAALVAPAGSPANIVQKLQTEIAAIARDPEFDAKMTAMGLQVVASTPSQFADYIRRESDKFEAVIRSANIKVE
ncbi:MAG: tripartite tricarboxylate transporter substrate binding protein [Variovorax sp.]